MSWILSVLLLEFVTHNVIISAVDTTLTKQQKMQVRRFLHGCPFAFPCALPPCDNPVFGPHDCCGSCPDPQPSEVTQTTLEATSDVTENGSNVGKRHELIQTQLQKKWLVRRFLHGCPFAFPCPPPPCDNPVFGPHDCCGSCPDPLPEVTQTTIASNPNSINDGGKGSGKEQYSAVRNQLSGILRDKRRSADAPDPTTIPTTTMPTTTCAGACVLNGRHYCGGPFPCHIRCPDAQQIPGHCCEVCPNGPACAYNGHIIPEGQNLTLPDGSVAQCYTGDLYGGSVSVFKPVG